jgi:hypothetical protein
MDPRDMAKGNGVSLSVAPPYVNALPGTNWGIPSASFVVTLDPQVAPCSSNLENAVESGAEPVGRGVLRRRMAELANEFAALHGDLLRELAR